MEKLWAVMIQKIQGMDSTVERIMNDNQEELVNMWNHQKHGDDLHAAWKESKILAGLEKLLSRLDQSSSSDLKRKREITDNGQSDHSVNDTRPEQDQLSTEYQITGLGLSNSNPSHQTNNIPTKGPSIVAAANLPESASNLLNHYFTYTHCWFPILSRPYTLKKLYEYRRSSKPTQPTSADLAVLWAVFAYSQQQMSRSMADSLPGDAMDVTAAKMRHVARSLIPLETGNFESGHVQALLIMVLLDMGTGSWSSAWVLIGLAVRILLDKIESLESLAKEWLATLQGCFILDTLIAVRLERPPHLQSDHLKRTRFLDEDGHEEWEPWQQGGREVTQSREPSFTISCFNRLTDLCMIVSVACLQNSSPLAVDQAVIQVHQVAQQFAFPLMTLEQRPPHQMLLQATYFAILVKLSHPNNESQAIPRWRFLETLELFDNTWGRHDQCGIPSLLADICYMVSSKANVPTENVTPQAKGAFCRRLCDVMLKLSGIWPDLKNATNIHMFTQPIMFEQRDMSQPRLDSQQVIHYEPQNAAGYLLQPGQAGIWPSQSSVFDNDLSSTNINPSASGRSVNRVEQEASLANPFAVRPTFEPGSMEYGSMSVDVPEPESRPSFGHALSQRASSTAGMATSPSFNGDEIDVLFHEMAELDTTQWSLDRSQALKDFGFSDDTTFEAFCNDPDRLMLSDAYMGPAFGQKGGVGGNQSLLTSNPSVFGQVQGDYGQSFDLDAVGNSWAG